MRVNEFILQNMEAILVEWEAFAASLLPAAGRMTSLALRDHAKQILEAVAEDVSTPQTKLAQSEKSMGRAAKLAGAPETAAQTHAALRAQSGFDINQLASEYRALRAAVLRLWLDAYPPDASYLDDIIRFNEAIDQAIAESVSAFTVKVDQARNLLLGTLGHDMRSPLNTIQMTAMHLTALNAGAAVSEAALRLIRSGASMEALLDDLVDFNRVNLGLGINVPVDRGELDGAPDRRAGTAACRPSNAKRHPGCPGRYDRALGRSAAAASPAQSRRERHQVRNARQCSSRRHRRRSHRSPHRSRQQRRADRSRDRGRNLQSARARPRSGLRCPEHRRRPRLGAVYCSRNRQGT
jgi:hypothetical protein